jgi:hypothetical protein
MFSGPPKQPTVDYAAQAKAQQAAREEEQAKTLAADRAKAVATAEEARDAEATRLKKQAAARGVATGAGALASGVETMSAALSKKLG